MAFTSSIFLICIFPWIALLYYFVGIKKNRINFRIILLLLANSLFYLWGGIGSFLFVCIYTLIVYLFAKAESISQKKWIMVLAVVILTIPLVFVKYSMFFIKNINSSLGISFSVPSIVVPLGISFFTFEAISLIVDTYKQKIKSISFIHTYLYLTFFATVTSGPIIRYDSFCDNLKSPSVCNPNYLKAVERIVIGLSKKVLIADKIAPLANFYFNGTATGHIYSTPGFWIGSIAYTLQLYFDFSGYSDMAIGIGQLLGFNIRENFNKPYQAGSISEFWKRWHISLTQWLKDYIYIPLGGNRCSIPRHLFNMLIVWLITGIWHGSEWTFLIWGLGYFVLLLIEKYIPFMKKIGSTFIGHIYTLFFVNLLWIPFRAQNLQVTGRFIRGMFGGGAGNIEDKALYYLPLLAVAVILCLPWNKWLAEWQNKRCFIILKNCAVILIFTLAICAIINSSYIPYIYGNF